MNAEKYTPQQAVTRLYEGIVYANLSKGEAIQCEKIVSDALLRLEAAEKELAEIKGRAEDLAEYSGISGLRHIVELIIKGEGK